MKKIHLIATFLLIITLSFSTRSFSQTKDTVHRVDYLAGQHAVIGFQNAQTRSFLKYFQSTIFPGYQQSAPPRFMIVGNDNNFILGIGGYVSFNAGYDFNGVVQNSDFVTSAIPTIETPQNQQQLFMDGTSSRLMFHFAVTNGKMRGLVSSIEFDFRGANGTARLRKAYIQYKDFLAGKASSTFGDLKASPATIDLEGANAYAFHRDYQLRYTKKIANNLWGAIALEIPKVSAEYSTTTQEVPQRFPDIPMWLEYDWSGGYIRASGIFRDMIYYSNTLEDFDNKLGWGVQLSGNINMFNNLFKLYYQGVYGDGIGRYIQDLEGREFDLAPSNQEGELDTYRAFGGFVGASANLWRNKLTMNMIYSTVELYDDKLAYEPDHYNNSQYFTVNLFYKIIPACVVAVEYNWGIRTNNDHNFGTANRIQAMLKYSF